MRGDKGAMRGSPGLKMVAPHYCLQNVVSRGGLATVALWRSPHGLLGSGPLRACCSQRRRKEKGEKKKERRKKEKGEKKGKKADKYCVLLRVSVIFCVYSPSLPYVQ